MAKGHKKIAGSYCYKGNGCTSRFCEFCSHGDKYEEIEDKEIKDESYLKNQYSTTETIKERIDELIIAYQERIRMENKFRDEELDELKFKILKDSLVSIEDKYTDLAQKIDHREKEIHRMEYFMNELKLIKKEIEND